MARQAEHGGQVDHGGQVGRGGQVGQVGQPGLVRFLPTYLFTTIFLPLLSPFGGVLTCRESGRPASSSRNT